MSPPRLCGDAGVVGGVEVLPFAVLTFVVGSLLVANAWAVVDAKLAVTSASREAVRRYVEAPDQAHATANARRIAQETMDGHGRDPASMQLRIEHEGGRPWARCTRVQVTVTYPIPALALPWLGGYGHGFDATASHSEIIDPFRSGVPGEGTC